MTLYFVKARNISYLAECVFRSNKLAFPCTACKRILFTKTSLLSNSMRIQRSENVKEDIEASNVPKDFGKIVDLDVNFANYLNNEEITKEARGEKWRIREVDAAKQKGDISGYLKGEIRKSNKKLIKDLQHNSRLFRSTVVDLRTKKKREIIEEVIIEGKRLINDVITAGHKPLKVFFSRKEDLKKIQVSEDVPVFKVPYASFKLWSDVVTSQGILAIFKLPELKQVKSNSDAIPLTVICDNVKDPGNLGSILRLSAAVGCEKIILINGCADIWDSKVLRSGAGAHFRVPITSNISWSDINCEIKENSKVVLAGFDSNIISDDTRSKTFKGKETLSNKLPLHCYHLVQYKENTVLILGGETEGLSDMAYEFALKRDGIKVFLPMINGIESLNNSVALGILVYEFKRQMDLMQNKKYEIKSNDSENLKNQADSE